MPQKQNKKSLEENHRNPTEEFREDDESEIIHLLMTKIDKEAEDWVGSPDYIEEEELSRENQNELRKINYILERKLFVVEYKLASTIFNLQKNSSERIDILYEKTPLYLRWKHTENFKEMTIRDKKFKGTTISEENIKEYLLILKYADKWKENERKVKWREICFIVGQKLYLYEGGGESLQVKQKRLYNRFMKLKKILEKQKIIELEDIRNFLLNYRNSI